MRACSQPPCEPTYLCSTRSSVLVFVWGSSWLTNLVPHLESARGNINIEPN